MYVGMGHRRSAAAVSYKNIPIWGVKLLKTHIRHMIQRLVKVLLFIYKCPGRLDERFILLRIVMLCCSKIKPIKTKFTLIPRWRPRLVCVGISVDLFFSVVGAIHVAPFDNHYQILSKYVSSCRNSCLINGVGDIIVNIIRFFNR